MASFVHRSRIRAPAGEVFAWHARTGAFERLAPPWQAVEVVERQGGIEPGGRATLRIPLGPARITWRLEHRDYVAGSQFCDVQLAGPFHSWRHTHRIEPDGPDACFLEDRIDYELPLGALGRAAAGGFVRRQLEQLFTYRHSITRSDIELARSFAGRPPMRIAVSGASGLIGSALVPLLTTAGHQVRRLVRSEPKGPDEVRWNPAAGSLDPAALEGCDAVIHLAGESIASHRWTAAQKQKILASRVDSTKLLAAALAKMPQPPRICLAASAIGYYGSRGDERLDESSAAGDDFLADVVRQWEAALRPAADAGLRVVSTRFGVVLSPAGGALKTMLTPFRLGLGGRVGSGRQWMSWIALDDAVGAIYHTLSNDSLAGPVNLVTPNPVTNLEFTKTLGRVLGRPTIFPLPAPAARLALGEMADALLLSSTRVYPARLLTSGYAFRFGELEPALRHLLGKA